MKMSDIRKFRNLKAGQRFLFTGVFYTARDQAHKRLSELIREGKKLPFSLEEKIIYYCGPNPGGPDRPIGACGPTTSSRMDALTVPLLNLGLTAMVGKGRRSPAVRAAIKKNKAVYFVTYAGCGALLAERVSSCRIVCFPDLGPEAVYELTVEDFPLITSIDSRGGSIYEPTG